MTGELVIVPPSRGCRIGQKMGLAFQSSSECGKSFGRPAAWDVARSQQIVVPDQGPLRCCLISAQSAGLLLQQPLRRSSSALRPGMAIGLAWSGGTAGSRETEMASKPLTLAQLAQAVGMRED